MDGLDFILHQTASRRRASWTDDAKAELHLLGMNLHNMAVEFQCRRHPAEAAVLEGYAIRIDELMKRAPEASA